MLSMIPSMISDTAGMTMDPLKAPKLEENSPHNQYPQHDPFNHGGVLPRYDTNQDEDYQDGDDIDVASQASYDHKKVSIEFKTKYLIVIKYQNIDTCVM